MKGKRIIWILVVPAFIAIIGSWWYGGRLSGENQQVTIVSAASNGCEDDYEPDDVVSSAKLLTEDRFLTLSFHRGGEVPDRDFFIINVYGTGELQVLTSNLGEAVNTKLTLVDENEDPIIGNINDLVENRGLASRLIIPVDGAQTVYILAENVDGSGGCGEEFEYKIKYNFTPLPTPTPTVTPTPTPTSTPTPAPTATPVPIPDYTQPGRFQIRFGTGSDRWSGYKTEGRINFGVLGVAEGWYDCERVIQHQGELWCFYKITTGPHQNMAWSASPLGTVSEKIRHPVDPSEVTQIMVEDTLALYRDAGLADLVMNVGGYQDTWVDCKATSPRVCVTNYKGTDYYIPFITHR